jgi:hypothetical protein
MHGETMKFTFFLFQKWGDYLNMSQAVVIYVSFATEVLLICWFGTQLTEHVRVNALLLLLLFLKRHVESFQQIRNLELLSGVDSFL